jgi:hypothetical protein
MATDLRAQLFDLSDLDRECLERIKQRLELQSSALAVRISIRELARRLGEAETKAPELAQDPEALPEGEINHE